MEEEPSYLTRGILPTSFVSVFPDGRSAEFKGTFPEENNVGVVQANCPAPTRKMTYYFEMTVENAGARCVITIGFTSSDFTKWRRPGCEENSCGYHGYDGMIYQGSVNGEKFGPRFTSGDTIGAGINYASQEFFFTKNGDLIGAVGNNTEGPMFPTVAVHNENEKVRVNFGQSPFRFDIQAYIREQRKKEEDKINNAALPTNICNRIVRSFLVHNCYEETLRTFDEESANLMRLTNAAHETFVGISEDYEISRRKILRQLILNGDIDSAMEKLREWYSHTMLMERRPLWALLHMQKFIELIRIGETKTAMYYARSNLSQFFEDNPNGEYVEKCFKLLAQRRPAESYLGFFLRPNQRELLATAVNVEILLMYPNVRREKVIYSDLERLLRKLVVCVAEMRAEVGGGEVFDLHQELC